MKKPRIADHWTEVRTAAAVARLGTVSAAAKQLNVHRATVNRHIDVLEELLRAKLFIRGQRGYVTTELGEELLRVADATDNRLSTLHRIAGAQTDQIEGNFIVATVSGVVPYLARTLRTFSQQNPHVSIQLITQEDYSNLERGEAHIAFRVGAKPTDPDCVVAPFMRIEMGLYASKEYIEHKGRPHSIADLTNHDFVCATTHVTTGFMTWLLNNVQNVRFRVKCNQIESMGRSIIGGLGLGFIPRALAQPHAELVEVLEPLPAWELHTWRVTHVDLHRTRRVQAFIQLLSLNSEPKLATG
ncbi:MAG: LysR family transcriptional regulator [Myxococcota bacterium]